MQDMRLTSSLRKRQVEELHQEEPTPVALVARPGSCSEPRKIEASTNLPSNPQPLEEMPRTVQTFFFFTY